MEGIPAAINAMLQIVTLSIFLTFLRLCRLRYNPLQSVTTKKKAEDSTERIFAPNTQNAWNTASRLNSLNYTASWQNT
jgi:hypothetical protein